MKNRDKKDKKQRKETVYVHLSIESIVKSKGDKK